MCEEVSTYKTLTSQERRRFYLFLDENKYYEYFEALSCSIYPSEAAVDSRSFGSADERASGGVPQRWTLLENKYQMALSVSMMKGLYPIEISRRNSTTGTVVECIAFGFPLFALLTKDYITRTRYVYIKII